MELWIATTNQGKLAEFRNLIPNATLRSINELRNYAPPPETGKTFEDNARLKARSLRAVRPDAWVVADDSGLEVDGLAGMPGVFSARYAGDKAGDAENVANLLKMVQIRTAGKRDAQFRCVLVAYDPSGKEYVVEGVVRGRVAPAARGKGGFGYDPVFIPEGAEKTFSELGPAAKNQVSHRARAIRQLLPLLTP